MINKEELEKVIAAYRKLLPERLDVEKEGFKWAAIKHFQDNWDIDAENFAEMFTRATEKCANLLASHFYFPREMIKIFAEETEPETVRGMFRNLYNEDLSLEMRVNDFIQESERLKKTYGDEKWKNSFQNYNSVSTYLWLRYPDKYYIFKFSEFAAISETLKTGLDAKRNGSFSNVVNAFRIYDEIASYLRSDDEIKNIVTAALTNEQYRDPDLKTLAIDVGFFISRQYDSESWFPALEDYNPNLTADDWVGILSNCELIRQGDLEVLKRFKDFGGKATCKQIAEKYGNTPAYYNMFVTQMCKRIYEGTDVRKKESRKREIVADNNYFPLMFFGRQASDEQPGTYCWKMRDELMGALEKINLENIELYEKNEANKAVDNDVNYYFLVANPKIWKPSSMAIGEEIEYTVKNVSGRPRRIAANYSSARVRDLVFCYEATPVKKIVSLARIKEASDGEKIKFEITKQLANPISWSDFKSNPELMGMQFVVNPNGSFFSVTKTEADILFEMIREDNPIVVKKQELQKYDKSDFLAEVFMTEEDYEDLRKMLIFKKNVILQGAPGVGKTFASTRLAYSMMGKVDETRIEMVQFHQSYSYEDFVIGYKPTDDGGFELKDGVFKRFCDKARNNPDNDFFFIIDEINRGNLSKIFGELLMAIEKEYRGTAKVKLAYGDVDFCVPKNLYIIGMMNTADRSLALMDYALRRRFGFFDIGPGFETDTYREFIKNKSSLFKDVIKKIEQLNEDILSDDSLGEGFLIGHSFFSDENITDDDLKNIVYYNILPTLKEYWFDDKQKYEEWEGRLIELFND